MPTGHAPRTLEVRIKRRWFAIVGISSACAYRSPGVPPDCAYVLLCAGCRTELHQHAGSLNEIFPVSSGSMSTSRFELTPFIRSARIASSIKFYSYVLCTRLIRVSGKSGSLLKRQKLFSSLGSSPDQLRCFARPMYVHHNSLHCLSPTSAASPPSLS